MFKFKQKFRTKKIALFFAVSLFLIQLASALPYAMAKAAEDPNTIKEKVFSFQAYANMNDTLGGGCAWVTDKGLTSNPGSWLANGNVSTGSAFNEYAGIHTDSGDLDCNDDDGYTWITKAINLWGYDTPEKFLGAIAQQCNNKCLELQSGDSKYHVKDSDGVKAAVKAILTKPGAYYAGGNLGGLSDSEKYYDALRNFSVQCSATFSDSPVSSGNNDKVTAQVTGVNGSSMATGYWHYDPSKNQVAVGSALGIGSYATCNKLAEMVTNTALITAFMGYANTNGVPDGAAAPEAGASSGSGGSADQCLDWSPLSWLMCPIIGLADGLYNLFVSFIKDILNINISDYEGNEGLKASWAVMRNVASSALVLVALMMVAGQVFNFEFMSAYTVKKILPRLVIAAIGIQLSWFIFTTVIVVMNAIGVGIYSLMLLPFQAAMGPNATEISTIYASQSNGGQIFSGVITATAGVAAFAGAGGLAGVTAVAIAGAFAICAALVTLILRKVLIIGLLVLAPLALVAWVLPGTQKFWTSWWNLFIKLLLMFPLIMVLIASGKIAASIIGQQDNAISPIIALVVYFLPLFLIPTTFKFAGGIFATTSAKISGMSGKWGQGLAKPWQERAQLNKDNSRWALSRKSRMADRQLSAQQRYAETLTGSRNGLYGRLTRRRSGASDEGRTRAEAAAASTITTARLQEFKEREALINFQVNEIADTNHNVYGRGHPNEGQRLSLYDRQVAARAQILNANVGDRIGNTTVTANLQDDAAIQALKFKDRDNAVDNYLADGTHYAQVADLGTRSPEAYQVLAQRLPTAAKGDSGPVITAASNGLADAYKGYADLRGQQQTQVRDSLLEMQYANDPRLVGILTEMAHNPTIDTQRLQDINTHLGNDLDLLALKADPNATLEFDASTGRFSIH